MTEELPEAEPVALVVPDAPPDQTWTARLADKNQKWGMAIRAFERTAVFQIAVILAGAASFVLLIVTFAAIQEEYQYRAQERENWRLDRIERAWNRVLRPVGGNTGKGEAINFLLAQDADLTGLNLRCASASENCDHPPIISGLRAPGGFRIYDGELSVLDHHPRSGLPLPSARGWLIDTAEVRNSDIGGLNVAESQFDLHFHASNVYAAQLESPGG